MYHNLALSQRKIDRLLVVEDLRQLLQSAPFSLDEEEVDEEHLKGVPENKQRVIPPPCARERKPGDKRIVQPSNVDPEVVEAYTFGMRLVAKNLDRVETLQGSPSTVDDKSENEDHCKLDIGFAAGPGNSCAGRV